MINRIIKYSILATLLGALILLVFLPDLSYSLGLVWGGSISLLAFWYLNARISTVKLNRIKPALLFNRIIRYLLYILAIIVSYLLPNILSIFTTIIGLFMIKLTVLVLNFTPNLESRGKK